MGVYMGNADVAVDIEGCPGHLGFTHDSQRLLSVMSDRIPYSRKILCLATWAF